MPRMTGQQFRDLQMKDPRLAGIPVVVISADNASGDAFDAVARVPKPLRIENLVQVLQQLFSGTDPLKH